MSPALVALALAATAQAPADAVTEAARGLVAQIEDEDHGDTTLKSLRAEGCTLTIEGEDRSVVLAMNDISGIGLGDPTFIAIARPGGITALVTDGQRLDQLTKLSELNKALGGLYRKCRR